METRDERPQDRYVSTGRLPTPPTVQSVVAEAHARFRDVDDGELSRVYPALSQADPTHFGVCVVGTSGAIHAAGDADVPFPMMSVAKPFVFALALEALGSDAARATIGVNATGLPFNAATAVERGPGGRTNPMVNAGAIATASHVPGDGGEKWETILRGLSAFAGRRLTLDEEVYASASTTNHVNRALAYLLHSRGGLGCEPALALDAYTRQSCLTVTAFDLATMGATLAGGGVNPVTREQVIDAALCHHVLAVMLTAGLYEHSGDWLYDVGQPGKSGIGGGIVTVAPGKGGMGTFSPLLDAAGNSVRGQLAARFLSQRLGLDLLGSEPRTPATT